MAEENLKDFTINWMVTGLLLTCLLAFTITFFISNNPSGLGDDANEVFGSVRNDQQGNLIGAEEDANTLLNITSKTNPEVSDLGSRDSVASSYEAKGSASQYWEASKQLISWVFSGTIGKILLATLGGMMGFLGFYYIYKFIRQGF